MRFTSFLFSRYFLFIVIFIYSHQVNAKKSKNDFVSGKSEIHSVSKSTKKKADKDKQEPVININGLSPIHLSVGTDFQDIGAKAYDAQDGDLTSYIVKAGTVNPNVLGTYKITYTVVDASGNSATAVRVVNIVGKKSKVDRVRPAISLSGGSPNIIIQGTPYIEPDVSAIDNVDGNITINVKIKGEVDYLNPGNYSITYSVSDKAGNKAEKIVRIKVKTEKKSKKDYLDLSDYRPVKEKKTRKTNADLIKQAEKKRPVISNKPKFLISLSASVVSIASLAGGLVFNNMLDKKHDAYQDAGQKIVAQKIDDLNKKKKLDTEIAEKRKEYKQTAVFRNLLYGGSALFAIGTIITIVIPFGK